MVSAGCELAVIDGYNYNATYNVDTYGEHVTFGSTAPATSTIWMTCPVTIDPGLTIDKIGIRVYDNFTAASTDITAYLRVQPSGTSSPTAAYGTLATVTSANNASVAYATGACTATALYDCDTDAELVYYVAVRIRRTSPTGMIYMPRFYSVNILTL